jgi:hypothetical protein
VFNVSYSPTQTGWPTDCTSHLFVAIHSKLDLMKIVL